MTAQYEPLPFAAEPMAQRLTVTYRSRIVGVARPINADFRCAGLHVDVWFSVAEARALAAALLRQCDAHEQEQTAPAEAAA